MVFVNTQAVEAHLLGKFQLVQVVVIELGPFLGVEETIGGIHPNAMVLLVEIVGQIPVGHQVKEAHLHRSASPALKGWLVAIVHPIERQENGRVFDRH